MSSFFLLLQRKGAPVSEETAEALFSAATSWPHEHENIIIKTHLAMGQSYRNNQRNDTDATLPMTYKTDRHLIYFAGDTRLDDRTSLKHKLSLNDQEKYSDALLITLAYLKWGHGLTDHLLGDFSFAIFDERNDSVIAVRDHLGVKPLYYFADDNMILFSDAIEVILAHPGINVTLNEKVMAEWCLNSQVFNQEETFFENVRKCPRATQISLVQNDFKQYEFWSIDDIPTLYYDNENDYIIHLQNLLTTAISDRITIDGNIASHLSGGLDSSPIAVLAGREITKRGQPFYTYNWCKPRAEDDAVENHEWSDARKIAAEEGFIHYESSINAGYLGHLILNHNIGLDGTTMFEYEYQLLQDARSKEVSLMLSGFGGDEILTARWTDNNYHLLRSGQFRDFYHNLHQDMTIRRLKWYQRISRYCLSPIKIILSSNLNRFNTLHQISKRLKIKKILLKRDFFESMNSSATSTKLSVPLSLRKWQVFNLKSGYHQERLETWSILGRKFGISYGFPLLDKRIVEFALAIPEELYFKNGIDRHLYRKALKGIWNNDLLQKRKPTENYRVKYFLDTSIEAILKGDVKKFILDFYNNPYIDIEHLTIFLDKLHDSVAQEKDFSDKDSIYFRAVWTAILAMNIRKKSGLD